jgi:hypothetical protein
MSVIDVVGNFNELQDCWFRDVLDNALKEVTPKEQQDAIAWVNTNVFDAAKAAEGCRSFESDRSPSTLCPEPP